MANVNFLDTVVDVYQDHELDVEQWGDNLVTLCTPCYAKRYHAGCDVAWHSEGSNELVCIDCGRNSEWERE